MKKSFLIFSLAAALTMPAFATVDAEVEGMEYEVRGDGTFLIGGPTYAFDRILGAGGTYSESELWTPAKLRDRLLFNRMSGTPSWTPMDPSVWLKTGNELGDLIYQNLLPGEGANPANRTPFLEVGVTTPSYKGFWVTARLFQDDHFSEKMYSYRKKMVDGSFAHFGENYPLFSTAYAGVGYTNSLVNASIVAGEEYLWTYTASSRWIPTHFMPRIEARADVKNVSVTLAYEDAEYTDVSKKERGARQEVNGSIYYQCDELCKQGMLQISAGLAFRGVSDSGTVYTELEEDRVFWPFVELRFQPLRRLTADLMFGINERDWLIQDSVQFEIPTPKTMGAMVGVKNISGTRLNPLADTKEFLGEHEINLVADGQMTLVQGYAVFNDTVASLNYGGKGSFWAEYGAETFDVEGFVNEKNYFFRYGNVDRIDSWIKGVTGEIWLNAWYQDMFKFNAMVGFERISGLTKKLEVTPAEYFVAFTGDWLINKTFRISHSVKYRSDAKWNLRSIDPLVVKGDWYWDVTFEQNFPKQGITFAGTLLHVLANEVVEVPNGNYDRLRFVCTARKSF